MAEMAIKQPLSLVQKLYERRTSDQGASDFGVKAYFDEICSQVPSNAVRGGFHPVNVPDHFWRQTG
jgi:hypothetical protein